MTSGRFDGISKDIERKLKKMRLTRDVVIRRDHAKIEGRNVHFVLCKCGSECEARNYKVRRTDGNTLRVDQIIQRILNEFR